MGRTGSSQLLPHQVQDQPNVSRWFLGCFPTCEPIPGHFSLSLHPETSLAGAAVGARRGLRDH